MNSLVHISCLAALLFRTAVGIAWANQSNDNERPAIYNILFRAKETPLGLQILTTRLDGSIDSRVSQSWDWFETATGQKVYINNKTPKEQTEAFLAARSSMKNVCLKVLKNGHSEGSVPLAKYTALEVLPLSNCQSEQTGELELAPSKLSVSDVAVELINRSEFLFVGETHFVSDERQIIENFFKFAGAGVSYLALEIAVDQKSALEYYIESGDARKFADPWDKVLAQGSEYRELIDAAIRLGVKVVFYDANLIHQSYMNAAEREAFMANELNSLPREGKKIVLTGAAHATLSNWPFPTLRSILSRSRATTAVKLESKNAAVIANATGASRLQAIEVEKAFTSEMNANSSFPSASFAQPTASMNELSFLNPYAPNSSSRLPYRSNFDYVIFLSPADSPLSPTYGAR